MSSGNSGCTNLSHISAWPPDFKTKESTEVHRNHLGIMEGMRNLSVPCYNKQNNNYKMSKSVCVLMFTAIAS